MRAKEFINEDYVGVNTEYLDTMVPSILAPKMDMYYEYYRFMTAIAANPEFDVKSSHDHFRDNPVALAYTPEEEKMLTNTLKKFGQPFRYLSKSKSQEPNTINKTSPVPHNSGRRNK